MLFFIGTSGYFRWILEGYFSLFSYFTEMNNLDIDLEKLFTFEFRIFS